MYRTLYYSALAACLIGLHGCSSQEFPVAQTTGRVLCEGQPVANAMVYFEPITSDQKESALVGKQGFSFTDEQGRFTISTYEPGKGDGAVVGKHRVRVGRGDADCNCAMNDEVDLMEVEVKKGETNEFELALKKATSRELAIERMNQDEDDEDE